MKAIISAASPEDMIEMILTFFLSLRKKEYKPKERIKIDNKMTGINQTAFISSYNKKIKNGAKPYKANKIKDRSALVFLMRCLIGLNFDWNSSAMTNNKPMPNMII